MTPEKTYKREVAGVLLLYYLAALTASGWFPEAAEMAESIKIPAFTFAAGSFGLDAVAKQWPR